ncbi:UDP:flavonoid glycosyltransferase YjiC, YdhE family [Clostridium cavendishii DSM 21758]|uniref:UDP:flavonoid glycosyltransferase YjiC, YdhE family n=1 Tax=Clostridium cavendishii DSM 21758 TaxID=1121302 RepID=A0A1M6N790_9CLOT|nr:nucleotide disphospho-sugar-binding domain-containing protein [Clostridium cavendishii]SHJ91569.1 UDP:flavonoid glycosyltransferase YjiC, YdhE family [Clostridium cavendishii DSM 21758]
MANIVISTHWGDGDVIPFISIGKYLKKQGHDVTIFTHCCYEERIKKEHINFVSWDTWDEYKDFYNDLAKCSYSVTEMDETEKFRAKYENVDVRIKEYELLKPYCKREDTILIAKNRSSIAALLVAEKLKLPLIWVYMNPYEYESIKTFDGLNKGTLCKEVNELRSRINLDPIESWLSWQCSPKKKVGLWPRWYRSNILNEQEDMDLVGFPLEPLDRRENSVIPSVLKNILLEKPAPIIISGGSSNKIIKDFYRIAIKACTDVDRSVIVATRFKELLPDTIPSNVHVFDYIPLYESLAYASLIIHHGGIGTISNAINTGVPHLILANCCDTPLNGSMIKKMGLGDYFPPLRCNEENVRKSINKLLTKCYKEKCSEFANAHKGENTFENIRKIVEDAVENEEYLVNYENMISTHKNIDYNTSNKNSNVKLSNNMKKYLLEKIKIEKNLK